LPQPTSKAATQIAIIIRGIGFLPVIRHARNCRVPGRFAETDRLSHKIS
jgi:hypothetical protein